MAMSSTARALLRWINASLFGNLTLVCRIGVAVPRRAISSHEGAATLELGVA